MPRNDGIGGLPRQLRRLPTNAGPQHTTAHDDVITHARRLVTRHMPRRNDGCLPCGQVYCRPFRKALAYLDRHRDPAARRVRAVLQLHGLQPPEMVPERMDDNEQQ
ncbi:MULTISPECIES: hypothetical protein [Micromonosporaceae]|uniref:hypothetical protein n=1 Tax=Micromonosporaceae TaxID=28056 RepID=UPI00248BD361|nr:MULTISPECIES: hypothetical protein [unclassified Solwaraspora]WBB98558.1 hypothetical protein O7553_06480 [Solwaraspora sp. WMMA2059]WBC22890.1 hypothetical protein O7543_10885 [Solwaraspora sp. WMMA2080]WFE19302.1 hypothetical protein O7621_15175 [Solwaraspora sp. WMMD937]